MNEILEKAKRLNSERNQGDWKSHDVDDIEIIRDDANNEICRIEVFVICVPLKTSSIHAQFIAFAPTVYDAYIAAHESYWALAEEYKDPTLNAQAYCQKYQVGRLGHKVLGEVIIDAESLRVRINEQSDKIAELEEIVKSTVKAYDAQEKEFDEQSELVKELVEAVKAATPYIRAFKVFIANTDNNPGMIDQAKFMDDLADKIDAQCDEALKKAGAL